MDRALESFLVNRVPIAVERVNWANAAVELDLAVYLVSDEPPDAITTSVRAVVFTDGCCAVLSNPDGVHVLPGGRRAAGETPAITLAREVLEETGCTIRQSRLLGALVFHHRTPKPVGYAYPYPDFVQVVFAVVADRDLSFRSDSDGYEERVEFAPPEALHRYALPAYQRRLVAEALRQGPAENTV